SRMASKIIWAGGKEDIDELRADTISKLGVIAAKAEQKNNYRAAVSALAERAEIAGLRVQKHEHSGPGGVPLNLPPEIAVLIDRAEHGDEERRTATCSWPSCSRARKCRWRTRTSRHRRSRFGCGGVVRGVAGLAEHERNERRSGWKKQSASKSKAASWLMRVGRRIGCSGWRAARSRRAPTRTTSREFAISTWQNASGLRGPG